MEQIEELLVAGGYFRARISTLSPFDKLTGGLAWCIAASNVDVDYDHLEYSDDLILGEKIQIGEAIESALQRMGCPHPLQAHQIQGLDYPAVLPVVQWLVKRVLDTRHEIGDQIRRYSHYHFGKNYELPIQHRSADNDSIRSHAEDPQSGHLQRISRQSRNLQLYFDRNVRVDYTVLEYGSHSAQSQALAKQLMDLEASENKLASIESCDEMIEKLQRELERKKEKLQFLTNNDELLDKGVRDDEQGISKGDSLSKLRTDLCVSEAQLEDIIEKLKLLTFLEQENAATSKDEQRKLEHNLKEQISLQSISEQSSEDLHEKKIALRIELARLSRELVVLKRRVDEVPVQSELMQYERCFMELYVNIQAKLRETRKYFASYNALVEANEFALKEISLLNSIDAQYETAIASTSSRASFIESMQRISNGAQQKLQKIEERCSDRESTYSTLKAKYGAALADRRRYYALLKQLQEAISRNEVLKSSKVPSL